MNYKTVLEKRDCHVTRKYRSIVNTSRLVLTGAHKLNYALVLANVALVSVIDKISKKGWVLRSFC